MIINKAITDIMLYKQYYVEILSWDAPFWVKEEYVDKGFLRLVDNFSVLCPKFKTKKFLRKPDYNYSCNDETCVLNNGKKGHYKQAGCCDGLWYDMAITGDHKGVMLDSFNNIMKMLEENNFLIEE